jgi:hypothetical protein
MKTGIAHVISDPAKRVQGLIIPNDAKLQPGGAPPATPATRPPPAAAAGPGR